MHEPGFPRSLRLSFRKNDRNAISFRRRFAILWQFGECQQILQIGSIFRIERALEKALSDAEGFFVAFGNRAGGGTASSMPRGYAPLPAAPLSFACIPELAAISGSCKRGNSKLIFPRLPANLVILGNIQGKSPEISLGYRK